MCACSYFCVTTNLTQGEASVHSSGTLWRLVRASMTVVGLVPPVSVDGDLLIDGGYLNNIPVDVMHQKGAPPSPTAGRGNGPCKPSRPVYQSAYTAPHRLVAAQLAQNCKNCIECNQPRPLSYCCTAGGCNAAGRNLHAH